MKLFGLICLVIFSSELIAAEDSLYDFSWLDQDKEIYVLQNRKFRKKNNFYLGGSVDKNTNQAFLDSVNANFLAGYFFKEDFGIEFVYNKQISSKTNNTFNAIKDKGAISFYRKIDGYMGAMFMWSPFYSKINTFNKIFYYDWLFGVGLASVNTKTNDSAYKTDTNSSDLKSESYTGPMWTTGLRFYLSDSWSVRLDFRALHLNTEVPDSKNPNSKTKKIWFHNYDFGAGVNFSF